VVAFDRRAYRTVWAAGAARLGTGAVRLVDDGLDGSGAATTVGVATKTAIKLLGISGQGRAGA